MAVPTRTGRAACRMRLHFSKDPFMTPTLAGSGPIQAQSIPPSPPFPDEVPSVPPPPHGPPTVPEPGPPEIIDPPLPENPVPVREPPYMPPPTALQ